MKHPGRENTPYLTEKQQMCFSSFFFNLFYQFFIGLITAAMMPIKLSPKATAAKIAPIENFNER